MRVLLSELESEVYGIEDCTELQFEDINKLYQKLNVPHLMTLKGFYIWYMIYQEEFRALNINKIHAFSQLCMKLRKVRKYLKKKKRWRLN